MSSSPSSQIASAMHAPAVGLAMYLRMYMMAPSNVSECNSPCEPFTIPRVGCTCAQNVKHRSGAGVLVMPGGGGPSSDASCGPTSHPCTCPVSAHDASTFGCCGMERTRLTPPGWRTLLWSRWSVQVVVVLAQLLAVLRVVVDGLVEVGQLHHRE